MPEIKELADKIQGATDALRTAATQYETEARKVGEVSAETKASLAKINTDLDNQKKALDEIGLKIERAKMIKPGESHDEQKAIKKAAFLKWFRQGSHNMEPSERKALVEDTAGLYAVPEEIMSAIYQKLPQINIMRQLCGTFTTSRDKVRVRSMSKPSVGWGKVETGTLITETTLVPDDDNIYVEDLYGLVKVGEDELADVDFNLEALITQNFAEAIGDAEASGFVIGTGHTYAEPNGIGVDTTLLTDIGSGKSAGATGTYGNNWTTDDTVTIEDLLECEYSLPSQYLSKNDCAWLMHRKTELAARVLRAGGYTAADGPWLWQPSIQAGMPNNIDGYAVYNNNAMNYPADTLAKTNVIFGNFRRGYAIVDRLAITVQRLNELYAESGLIGFKVHFRVGGGLVDRYAFQLISNDT